ncbi:MAG: hypothetical protein JXA03_02720 [Bacteroidales bacterium]|nr:hypothetical protein [Bacteroidales bacterium]
MEDPYCCPNMEVCRLVTLPGFDTGIVPREHYLQSYCRSESQKWLGCKRFITKNELGFCPDFVLPDSDMDMDMIIDKFDEKESIQ